MAAPYLGAPVTATTTVWDRVPGQARAVELLQRAAERPAHAYLLVGARGSGVEDAARCFAAAIVAPDGNERAVDLAIRGAHPDVVEIDPAANQIRMEDAQQIIDEAYRSPIEGARKVSVIFGKFFPPSNGVPLSIDIASLGSKR